MVVLLNEDILFFMTSWQFNGYTISKIFHTRCKLWQCGM